MNREAAYELVTSWTKNKNLVKHMLAVEAEMRALAKHFGEDEDLWGLAGLVHDADYEILQEDGLEGHPFRTVEKLKEMDAPKELISAVESHAWKWNKRCPKPESKMDWALYTCDELSGLIIAVALVRPDKKLSSVEVGSVMKKWDQKSFASGVHREQIELCEEKLGIKLEEFVEINLKALQGISEDLGL
jgi:putative nucleotidyltransferase with HDIG domain